MTRSTRPPQRESKRDIASAVLTVALGLVIAIMLALTVW
jgi:hypothetical protein